ncbi:MAG: hypothetical protein IPH97_13455 [Ignavibacteriales bacterium]|nr:hypothetical protein [Ignavibacteriales bacterium]
MKYSICVIENKIPVIDQRVTSVIDSSQRLSISNIKYLLNEVPKNEWEEEVVYTLLEDLIHAEFFTSAFLNPSFFLNYNAEQEPYRPEIIILDWDIEGIDSEEYLLKLLEFSFSLICIYTGVDKKDEIEKIISQQRFNKYSERLPKLIFKGDENSVETLINLIQDKNNENFSFRFGKELRNRSVDASEKMLIELGKTTQNHISNYFAYSEDNKFDLIDFFAARYKNYLADIDFKVLEESKTVQATGVENQIAQAFWSHRIYFYGNNSRFVKKGDIVKKKDQDEYFLVINADCDLNKFWHKNQGSLAIIPYR